MTSIVLRRTSIAAAVLGVGMLAVLWAGAAFADVSATAGGKMGPPIPPWSVSKDLILAGHTGGPAPGAEAGCVACHNVAAPPSITPDQVTAGKDGPTIGADKKPHANQACDKCHAVSGGGGAPDTAPPTTTSNAAAAYVGRARIVLTATDNAGGSGVGSIKYKIDGGDIVTVNAPAGLSATAGGKMGPPIPPWSVSKDLILAGHTGGPAPGAEAGCVACHNVAAPPSITPDQVTAGKDGPTIGADKKPHANQACDKCHAVSGGGTATPTPGPGAGAPLTATVVVTTVGAHTLEFWAVDNAGNAETPRIVDFSVSEAPPDPIAPTTTSDAAAAYVTSASIVLSATDNAGGSGVASIKYKIDGGDIVTVNAPAGLSATAGGKMGPPIPPWSVSKDLILAGHTGGPAPGAEAGCVACHNVAAPPSITPDQVTAGKDGPTIGADKKPHANQACDKCHAVSGTPGPTATPAPGPSPTPAPGPTGPFTATAVVTTVGVHTLEFWAVDNAGNAEAAHTARFTIIKRVPDSTPPTTRSDARAVYSVSASISLAAVDNLGGSGVARIYYRLNGDNRVTYDGPVLVPSLGTHTLEFWSIDTSGNVESPRKRVTFSVAPAVLPKAVLSNPLAPSSARRGRAFTVSGYLRPKHVAGTYDVRLYCYRLESGAWRLRKTVSARVANHSSYESRYSRSLSLPAAGRWRVRARHADATHQASWSARYCEVRVR